MKALIGWAILLLIVGVLGYALVGLFRYLFGKRTPKQQIDDAGDISDAAKVGAGLVAVAVYFVAPVGLVAVLAGLKLASVAPVVSLAPALALIFAILITLGSALKLISRRRSQRERDKER